MQWKERKIVCSTGEIASSYSMYLKTDHWRRFRFNAICKAASTCQKCGTKTKLHLHHLHYKTIGNEDFCDVAALCGKCHKSEHYRGRTITADESKINRNFVSEKFIKENALIIVKAMGDDAEQILTEAFESNAIAIKVMNSKFYKNHPLLNRH